MVRQTARADIRLNDQLRGEAEAFAATQDRSLSWVVREALREYLDRHAPQPANTARTA